MAVRIRLTRFGRKKKPFYRIVVADSERQRDGKFLDIVGTYDPMQNPAEIKINAVKLQDWMGKGALPSTTVKSLIKKVSVSA
jgi:small subunit ribosomal protein S16